ncbi:hypothetical protein BCR33DRAFT_853005 [Rhizoclosmatium globosum]|uniref:Uncharacterized protein n=1 Tax=Rhizoclosmatium globosum TaxID=329046 RepID=A0A1Y2BYM5_9FUNG|nr:hypothetical protein BCR33DRAFT_853005 [Rhizoclosmatium globosum]|eukprot:ORY39851.1 hypothetical protein BCR33DRAFT_853005 [Rhizoclosmatium globosum]
MIQVYYCKTFFSFTTPISVSELLHLLKVRRDQYPSVLPINDDAPPISDSDEPIPDGIYTIVTVNSVPKNIPPPSLNYEGRQRFTRDLQGHRIPYSDASDSESNYSKAPSEALDSRPRATETPKFREWYYNQFGRDVKELRFAGSTNPKHFSKRGDEGSECGESDGSRSSRFIPTRNHARAPSSNGDSIDSDVLYQRGREEQRRKYAVEVELNDVIEEGGTDDGRSTASGESLKENSERWRESSRKNHQQESSDEENDRRENRKERDLPALPHKARSREREENSGRRRNDRNDSPEETSSEESVSIERGRSRSRERHGNHKGEKRIVYTDKDRQFDNDMKAGIKAMSDAVASIPERYYKYNAILSKKLDHASTRVSHLHQTLSKTTDPIRTRILQVQLLSILQAVWRTAWERYTPGTRRYATSDISAGRVIHAEGALNNLHMWKRIVEADCFGKGPRNSNAEFLEPLRLMDQLPTHLFRRSGYNPAYIYLARYNPPPSGVEDKSEAEIISEIRVTFLDLAMRQNVYRDEELNAILTDVVDTYRSAESQAESKPKVVWDMMLTKLRKEFWLNRKPENLQELVKKWDGNRQAEKAQQERQTRKTQSESSSSSDDDTDDREPEPKVKNRVRWDKDRYYG